MRTIASETERLGLTLFKTLELKRELSYKNHSVSPCVVPAGVKVDIYFSKNTPSRVWFDYAGHIRATRTINAKDTFHGGNFTKRPSIRTLKRWSWDGGCCKTVTGFRTEPDGYGPDGSPSWMLVMGVI
jgi:hypothetical protein